MARSLSRTPLWVKRQRLRTTALGSIMVLIVVAMTAGLAQLLAWNPGFVQFIIAYIDPTASQLILLVSAYTTAAILAALTVPGGFAVLSVIQHFRIVRSRRMYRPRHVRQTHPYYKK